MSVYGRESDSPYHSEIAVHHQRVKSAYRPKQSASAKRSLYAVLFDAEQNLWQYAHELASDHRTL